MTAPDHRPYAVPGDLITAGDAICELIRMSDEEGAYTRKEGLAIRRACYALLARLDRERRQACRRATRAWAFLARMHRRNADMYAKNDDRDEAMSCRAARANSLQAALAFRAAARQP